jgi:DTW domain-containing protein YfiP
MVRAMACAQLTRGEMDPLKVIGLDQEATWTQARNLYRLAPQRHSLRKR